MMRVRCAISILLLAGCDGSDDLAIRPGPTATQRPKGADDQRDGESTLPPLPIIPGSEACESTATDVCGEYSPAAIAKCIEAKGGEAACKSSRWERKFYTYIVGLLPAADRAKHCFADGAAKAGEVCGPFSETLIAACVNAEGGTPCYGNRWSQEFHTSLSAPVTTTPVDVNNGCSGGNCGVFPTKKRGTKTCEEAGGGVGSYGAWRDGGTRKHAGCDLYGTAGDSLYSIQAGTVVAKPYDFYCDTDALEMRYGRKIIRYGEIKPGSATATSGTVASGQLLARMGQLSCVTQSMLHFEMFAGTVSGPLSTSGNIYKRRSDVENPTTSLKTWRGQLP